MGRAIYEQGLREMLAGDTWKRRAEHEERKGREDRFFIYMEHARRLYENAECSFRKAGQIES